MKRKFRSVFKTGKYVFAAFLILSMTILSAFSASATSVYSNQAVTDSINGVPYTFEMIYNTGDNYDSMLYSFSPIFYDQGVNPLGLDSSDSSRSYYESGRAIGASGIYYYESSTRNDFIQLRLPFGLNFDPLVYDNTGHFVGSAIVSNTIDFYKDTFLNTPSGTLKLKAQDFSSWTDIDGNSGSEIIFDFRPLSNVFSFGGIRINYSIYGHGDTVYSVTLPTSEFFIVDGCFCVIPGILGLEEYGVYIYIHDLELDINFAYDFGYLFNGNYWLDFRTIYTFNPYLYDISYGVGGDPGSFNPAVPLLDYTEFIGNAVSGVLDLELFPNFTLGGIFMTVLAFVCVVWFLKLVAGG